MAGYDHVILFSASHPLEVKNNLMRISNNLTTEQEEVPIIEIALTIKLLAPQPYRGYLIRTLNGKQMTRSLF
jgi:hypothetical protein